MVAITATNSATPSPQATLARSRVDQARREADQAESNAQNLRAQANAAELDAQKSQEKLRALTTRKQQEDTTYIPKLTASRSEVPQKTQEFLVEMYSAASDKFAASGNALKANPRAASVVNAQGHKTGRILDTSA